MLNSLLRRREPPSPTAIDRSPNSQRSFTEMSPNTQGPSSRLPLIRRFSNETLSTLVDDLHSVVGTDDNDNDVSTIQSNSSDETIFNSIKIFNTPLSLYTKKREFPIISNFFSGGVMVFESCSTLLEYRNELKKSNDSKYIKTRPMLHTEVPVLVLFKKKPPFMIIHKYTENGEKVEYCTVYFKVLANNLTSYIITFNPELCKLSPIVLLNNDNSFKPSVDFTFSDCKVRVLGISGATSTFGTSSTRTFIMDKTSLNLSDDLKVEFKEENLIKNLRIVASQENELANLLIGNKSNSSRFKSLMNGKVLLQSPFASYTDDGNKRIGSLLIRHGTINCLDEEGDVSEKALVITCINLVLREQEYRKNRGNNKPMFVPNPIGTMQNGTLSVLNGEVRDL